MPKRRLAPINPSTGHKRAHKITLPTITKDEKGQTEVVTYQKFDETEIPTDILAEYGVTNTEFGDFWKALHFNTLLARKQTIVDACKYSGIPRSALHGAHWKRLIGIARTMLVGQAVLQAQAVSSYVFEKWPEITYQLVNTALHAERDSDKIDAAELLHYIFIDKAQEERDASPEQEYLKNAPSFNPAQPIQMIQAQSVTINNISGQTNPAVDENYTQGLNAAEDPPSLIVDVEALPQL